MSLDVRDALGEALELPLVAVDLPRSAFKHGTVKLAIERCQVPEFARLMGLSDADNEVAVLPADVATELMDELERLDRVEPRLASPGRVRSRMRDGLGDLCIESEGNGFASTVYFARVPRKTEFGFTHRGGVWWGEEERRDRLGRLWTRRLSDLVTDDFGVLVSSKNGVAP